MSLTYDTLIYSLNYLKHQIIKLVIKHMKNICRCMKMKIL